MKLNISDPKSAQSYSIEADEKTKIYLLDKKIKDEVVLEFLGAGYKGVITGGSDKQGFPMNISLISGGSKRVLLSKGSVGFRPTKKGERRRKRIANKVVDQATQQVNIKLLSGDTKILEEKYKKVKEEKPADKK
ncbi:MAG: S6e family ribosomal protein [archaeon]